MRGQPAALVHPGRALSTRRRLRGEPGSALVDGQSDEPRAVLVFHLEQGGLAAILGGGVNDAHHVGGLGHVLVVDGKNDVAGAQAAFLGDAVR